MHRTTALHNSRGSHLFHGSVKGVLGVVTNVYGGSGDTFSLVCLAVSSFNF